MTYSQLCSDFLQLRNVLAAQLSPSTRRKLKCREDVYIALQAPGSYDFAVGFFAILALGAVVVPISPHAAPNEIQHYFRTCGIQIMLLGGMTTSHATAGQAILTSRVSDDRHQNPLPASSIAISSAHALDCSRGGLAVFTSGTTGPPKACILPREILCSGTQTIADHFRITSDDTVLHCLPVHHAAGILISFLPFILCGGCVEFGSGSFKPDAVWQRWRRGGLTAFTGVPTMYARLMQYYETQLLPTQGPVLDECLQGARAIRLLLCGTSALPKPLRLKWSNVTRGRRILERYGTTEFSGLILMAPDHASSVPDGSVGTLLPGVEVQLSNGDEGEILVKAPAMFLEYLGQPEATRAAHDEHGFYRTGDIARREGPHYFILGRASTDILKSGGYKISALDIEREILGLPYVAEVAVVGVVDEEFGQRVAAAVVLSDRYSQRLDINHLRNDLRTSLAGYKLPTVLWVAASLPKTAMGKVQKKTLVKQVFENEEFVGQIQVWKPGAVSAGDKGPTLQARL